MGSYSGSGTSCRIAVGLGGTPGSWCSGISCCIGLLVAVTCIGSLAACIGLSGGIKCACVGLICVCQALVRSAAGPICGVKSTLHRQAAMCLHVPMCNQRCTVFQC